MTKTVYVNKTITIDVEEIEVDRNVEIDVDYVDCARCGKLMAFDVTVDGYGDLQITASPCECVKEEK